MSDSVTGLTLSYRSQFLGSVKQHGFQVLTTASGSAALTLQRSHMSDEYVDE